MPVFFVALMALVGCGPPDCDGQSSSEPLLGESGDAEYSPGEKDRVIKKIEDFDTSVRLRSPKLFCQFEAWELTNLVERDTAEYNPDNNRVRVPPSVNGIGAAFAKHVFVEYQDFEGKKPYNESDWNDVSCVENDLFSSSLEDCIDHPFTNAPSREDELARVLGLCIESPGGCIIKYSTNDNTYKQAQVAAKVGSYTEEDISEIFGRIFPQQPLQVTGLTYPLPDTDPANPKIYRAANGTLGYPTDSGRIKLLIPDNDGIITDLTFNPPAAVQLDKPFTLELLNDIVLIHQNGIIYSANTNTSDINWQQFPIEADITKSEDSIDGTIQYVGGLPTYMAKAKYWLADSIDTSTGQIQGGTQAQNYPDEIKDLLKLALSYTVINTGGETFLWLHGGEVTNHGRESSLYKMTTENGELKFDLVFNMPTTIEATPPVRYNDNWYVGDRISNDALSTDNPTLSLHGSALVMFKVNPGNQMITPHFLEYGEDQQDLRLPMGGLYSFSLISSGSSLIGISRLNTDWATFTDWVTVLEDSDSDDPVERLPETPTLLTFDLTR